MIIHIPRAKSDKIVRTRPEGCAKTKIFSNVYYMVSVIFSQKNLGRARATADANLLRICKIITSRNPAHKTEREKDVLWKKWSSSF